MSTELRITRLQIRRITGEALRALGHQIERQIRVLHRSPVSAKASVELRVFYLRDARPPARVRALYTVFFESPGHQGEGGESARKELNLRLPVISRVLSP